MNQHRIFSHKFLTLLCLLLMQAGLPDTVFAALTGPLSASIQGGGLIRDRQANSLRIIWSGQSDSTRTNSPGQAYQVFSTEGRFEVNQIPVATHRQRIRTNLISGRVNNFSIPETLRVPRQVLFAARQAGRRSIQYIRTFSDESGRPDFTSSVTLTITSDGTGTLNISRIDLRFQDGSIQKIMQRENPVTASAFISYSGSGLLSLAWEVATPATAAGTPVFKRLKTVRRFLGAGRSIILESPILPARQVGNYVLRLRIGLPDVSVADSLLRYSVIQAEPVRNVIKKIKLQSPLPDTVIDSSTEFIWQPVAAAVSYQLEIYLLKEAEMEINPDQEKKGQSEKGKTLATGILLPSHQHSSFLTLLVLQRLQTGERYVWRTLAIGADGKLLGKSDFRSMIFSGP